MDFDIPQCTARISTGKTKNEMPTAVDNGFKERVIALLVRSLQEKVLL